MRWLSLLLIIASVARSATLVSDGSDSDIQALHDSIATDGDTITGPAGTFSWSTGVIFTKAITLRFAGSDQSTIQDNAGTGLALIKFNLVANRTSRLTGVKIVAAAGSSGTLAPRIEGEGTDIDDRALRIDHCWFDDLHYAMFLMDSVNGVIDHNVGTGEASGVPAWIGQIKGTFRGGAQGVNIYGDGSWAAGDRFGTKHFTFFEDNLFTNKYAPNSLTSLDCHSGGRYVFRFNTNINGSMETHGAESSRYRGGRAFEIYGNYFDGLNNVVSVPLYMRGGVGVVWSNQFRNFTTLAVLALLDNRSLQHLFTPFNGSTGRNPWDKNNAGNPFDTGTATSAGTHTVTDSSKSWTVNQWAGYTINRTSGKAVTSLTRSGTTCTVSATGHGFSTGNLVSIFGANQYGYNGLWSITVVDANTFTFTTDYPIATPATGTIKACLGGNFAAIDSNTGTQITFAAGVNGAAYELSLTAGDTFEINKVDQAMDQPGISGGTDLAGAAVPAVPGGWNDQTVSAWYEWENYREGGANVNFSNGRSSGNYATIQENVHFYNDTVKPGYGPYDYPHPLISETDSAIPRPPKSKANGKNSGTKPMIRFSRGKVITK